MKLFWTSVVVSLVSIGISISTIVSSVDEHGYHCDHEREAEFWRALYLQADKDAHAVNCESIDANYVICEKANNGLKR